MVTFGKKTASEDEESDDMGSTKLLINKKPNSIKKRKRNNTKQEEEEQDEENVINSALLDNNSICLQEQEEQEKKKLKKEKKQKQKQKATPKKKAPLDLDRQCGVLIAPSNNPCTRSLTCKIHAMGAKRAVEGRSQPFNELLAAYQKKGIGRPHVPGTMNDKDGTIRSSTYALDSTNITANTKKHTSTSSLTKHSNNGNVNSKQKISVEVEADIDSDEETENVRLAIEQSKPIPLGIKQLFYVKRKRKYCKLRDILLEAITPKDNNTSATNNNSNTNEVYTSIMNQGTF